MDKMVNNMVRIEGIGYATDYDVSYQDEKYFNLYYDVIGIGDISDVDCTFAEYSVMGDLVQLGERVLLRWYAVSEAYERGSDRDGFYYVRYEDIVAVQRDGWKPVNDHIFVSSDNMAVTGSGKVIAVANDVIEYVGYDGDVFAPTKVNVGDYVVGRPSDMREIEHLFIQKMNTKVFAIQSKDLLMISEKEVKFELY